MSKNIIREIKAWIRKRVCITKKNFKKWERKNEGDQINVRNKNKNTIIKTGLKRSAKNQR